jgi:choline dehydrogenase-like flavoprotein
MRRPHLYSTWPCKFPLSSHLHITNLRSSVQSPFDLYILTKATERARRFANQPSMKPFLATELAPGAAIATESQITQFVKDSMGVAYHPLGTAAIGDRATGGVVDANLRVYGPYSYVPCLIIRRLFDSM